MSISKERYVQEKQQQRLQLANKRLQKKSFEINKHINRHEKFMEQKRNSYIDHENRIEQQIDHFRHK